uniref:Reduced folate carrier n=1 Tax=Panagrellus redivivus TaxID=6233 RepID=A0A7E4VBB4_PANRE
MGPQNTNDNGLEYGDNYLCLFCIDNTMAWWISTALICAYGALKEFRPTEPYYYNYEHDFLGYSDSQLNNQIYPVWTYVYLVALLPVLLCSDILLYKPVIIIGTLAYIGVWLCIIFAKSVLALQFAEANYAIGTASEVAYFSYIYVRVDSSKFSRVTAWTRAALLLGRCTSYILAEILILTKTANYQDLNYISIGVLGISLAVAICLPGVSWKTVVERNVEHNDVIFREAKPQTFFEFCKTTLLNQKTNFVNYYSKMTILKWSLWWAMATCGELQIESYAQTLFGQLQDANGDNNFNGFIEAAWPFFGMIAILAVEKANIDWNRWGEACLSIAAIADSVLLIIMSQAGQLWLMYACFVLFRVFYQIMITIAQANIVTEIASHSYGFVFGVNTLVALILQTVLTAVVVQWWKFGIRDQFIAYGIYHAGVSVIFVSVLLYRFCRPMIRKFIKSSNFGK